MSAVFKIAYPRILLLLFPSLELDEQKRLFTDATRKRPSEGAKTETKRQKGRTSQYRKRRNWGDEDAKWA